MPTLDWIGKNAVLNHYRQVPYRLLRRVNLKGETVPCSKSATATIGGTRQNTLHLWRSSGEASRD